MADPEAVLPDTDVIRLALACKCPRCRRGALYAPGPLSLSLRSSCPDCGLDFSHDGGDGAAVFLIFVLGFLLVPAALVFEFSFSPPLWLHGLLWPPLGLALTVFLLRPLKAYIFALEYKHRRNAP